MAQEDISGAQGWLHNAGIRQVRDLDWDLYCQGYRMAADWVVERLGKENLPLVNFAVFPVVFLYRQ